MRIVIALLACLCAPTAALSGQIYGEWERPCPLGLTPRFSFPFVSGVIYGGKEFLTKWRSIDQTPPLPSRNWYEATPERNPRSTDGTSRWYGARVQGLCTVERTPYFVTYHVYPIAYQGEVRPCSTSGGRTGPTPLADPQPSSESDAEFSSTTGEDCGEPVEGGEGETGSTCSHEYVYIEISYDDGNTWETLWEGWATVCG